MTLKERFEAMLAEGAFADEEAKELISALLKFEDKVTKQGRDMVNGLVYNLIWIGRMTGLSKDVSELLSSQSSKQPAATSKLVEKDVSPDGKGVTDTGECSTCGDDEPVKKATKGVPSISLTDVNTYRDVLAYFDNDEAKIDAWISTMGVEHKASTLDGKAKKVLETIKSS